MKTYQQAYREFLAAFAAAACLKPERAAEQWAGYSRDLSDAERQEIENEGDAGGRREGSQFFALYGK